MLIMIIAKKNNTETERKRARGIQNKNIYSQAEATTAI